MLYLIQEYKLFLLSNNDDKVKKYRLREIENLKRKSKSKVNPVRVSTGNINFHEPSPEFLNLSLNLNHLAIPNPIFWQTGFVLKLTNLFNILKGLQNENQDHVRNYINKKWSKKINSIYKSKTSKRTKLGVGVNISILSSKEKNFFESYLFRLYKQIQEENLNYGGLLKRKQGKNSTEQKLVLAKRC